MNNSMPTPEQILEQEARDQWERERETFFLGALERFGKAGASAEAFHKFLDLCVLLEVVDDPRRGHEEEPDRVDLARRIRDYLEASWVAHREGRLAFLRGGK